MHTLPVRAYIYLWMDLIRTSKGMALFRRPGWENGIRPDVERIFAERLKLGKTQPHSSLSERILSYFVHFNHGSKPHRSVGERSDVHFRHSIGRSGGSLGSRCFGD